MASLAAAGGTGLRDPPGLWRLRTPHLRPGRPWSQPAAPQGQSGYLLSKPGHLCERSHGIRIHCGPTPLEHRMAHGQPQGVEGEDTDAVPVKSQFSGPFALLTPALSHVSLRSSPLLPSWPSTVQVCYTRSRTGAAVTHPWHNLTMATLHNWKQPWLCPLQHPRERPWAGSRALLGDGAVPPAGAHTRALFCPI